MGGRKAEDASLESSMQASGIDLAKELQLLDAADKAAEQEHSQQEQEQVQGPGEPTAGAGADAAQQLMHQQLTHQQQHYQQAQQHLESNNLNNLLAGFRKPGSPPKGRDGSGGGAIGAGGAAAAGQDTGMLGLQGKRATMNGRNDIHGFGPSLADEWLGQHNYMPLPFTPVGPYMKQVRGVEGVMSDAGLLPRYCS